MDTSEEGVQNQNPEPPIHPPNFVVIRDDYFVHHESPVFPPTHHEDLPVPPPDQSEPSESPSPAVVSELRWRAVGESIMRCCEILKAKVISGISGIGSYAAASRCSVLPVTAMAALLALTMFLMKMRRLPWRRRRTVSVRRDDEQRLLLLVKHKDEEISQLLLKIAQMNETLSSHGRVRVLRIK